MTDDEQRFWDAASIAGMAYWEAYTTAQLLRGGTPKTRAEIGALFADELLEQRRARKTSTSA